MHAPLLILRLAAFDHVAEDIDRMDETPLNNNTIRVKAQAVSPGIRGISKLSSRIGSPPATDTLFPFEQFCQ